MDRLIKLTVVVVFAVTMFLVGRIVWAMVEAGNWAAYGLFLAAVFGLAWVADTDANKATIRREFRIVIDRWAASACRRRRH